MCVLHTSFFLVISTKKHISNHICIYLYNYTLTFELPRNSASPPPNQKNRKFPFFGTPKILCSEDLSRRVFRFRDLRLERERLRLLAAVFRPLEGLAVRVPRPFFFFRFLRGRSQGQLYVYILMYMCKYNIYEYGSINIYIYIHNKYIFSHTHI